MSGVTAAALPDAPLDVVFGALADPTRRALVQRLVVSGPASATVLASSFPFSRQAVVKHLQALETAGLVVAQRVGREVQYRAEPAPMAAAIGWMLDSGAAWDRRIDRLRQRPARGARSATGAN